MSTFWHVLHSYISFILYQLFSFRTDLHNVGQKHTLTKASYTREQELSDYPHSSGFIFCFPSTTEGEKQEEKEWGTPGSHTPTYTKKERQLPLSIWQSWIWHPNYAGAHTHTVSTQAATLSSERPLLFHALNWSELHYSRLALSSAETHWVHFNSRALKENFCHRCVSFLCFHVDICIVALYICQSNSRVIILYLV